jgi:general stress protein 26
MLAGTRRVLTVVALASAITARGRAQPAAAPPPDRAQILRAARDVMASARYATLVTVADDGEPQARIVDPAGPDSALTVWIGTNASTRKVEQLRKNPRTTLLYFDTQSESYVTLIGTATIVTDDSEKARHWQEKWAPFYPGGAKSPILALIRFVPRRLEIVSSARGMKSDPRTWRPVILDLP